MAAAEAAAAAPLPGPATVDYVKIRVQDAAEHVIVGHFARCHCEEVTFQELFDEVVAVCLVRDKPLPRYDEVWPSLDRGAFHDLCPMHMPVKAGYGTLQKALLGAHVCFTLTSPQRA